LFKTIINLSKKMAKRDQWWTSRTS